METMSKTTARGYETAVKLLLSYSAFEAACTAGGIDANSHHIDSDTGFSKAARLSLIKEFGKKKKPTSLLDLVFPTRG